MKKIFEIICLGLLAFTSNAQSTSFSLEGQNTLSLHNGSFSGIAFMGHSFKNTRVGLFGFGLVSKNFNEMFVGPTYLFSLDENSILEIGTGIGIENYKQQPIRCMTYVYIESNPLKMNKHKLQCLFDTEYLGSGPWYLAYATYNVTNHFGIGIHAQQNVVQGMRFQVYPISWLMVYGVAGWNFEANDMGFMACAKISFSN